MVAHKVLKLHLPDCCQFSLLEPIRVWLWHALGNELKQYAKSIGMFVRLWHIMLAQASLLPDKCPLDLQVGSEHFAWWLHFSSVLKGF